MRGENADEGADTMDGLGSSPHARGKLIDMDSEEVYERLIPACAGKTTCEYSPSFKNSAHPRMRGENEKIGV